MVAAIHLLVALEKANLAEPLNVILLEKTLFPEGIVTVCPFKILAFPVKSLGLVQVAEVLKFPDPVLFVVVCALTMPAKTNNINRNKFFISSFYVVFSAQLSSYLFAFVAL